MLSAVVLHAPDGLQSNRKGCSSASERPETAPM